MKDCVSLEVAKKLQAAGFKGECEWWWRGPLPHHGYNEWTLEQCTLAHGAENIPAPTATQLAEDLPVKVCWRLTHREKWCLTFGDKDIEAMTLPDALGKMLVYLLKNGLIQNEATH